MNGFLLDTNVMSEIVTPEPDPRVVVFLTDQSELWLSTIVLHEIEFGPNLLPHGNRRTSLAIAFATFAQEYIDRILPVNRREPEQAAALRAQARGTGQMLHLADALIAGTAKTHDLFVATRNAKDFERFDVAVANPWADTDSFTAPSENHRR